MKKLTTKEMKQVQGGAPPLCVQICNNLRKRCLAQGNSSAYCEEQLIACIEFECSNPI